MGIKPGMLCWISPPNFPENVGVVVEVLSFRGMVPHAPYEFWEVRSHGFPMRGSQAGSRTVTFQGYAVYPGLIPITDPDIVIKTETEDELPALLRESGTV